VSDRVYGERLALDPDEAYSFVEARVSFRPPSFSLSLFIPLTPLIRLYDPRKQVFDPSPKSPRITPLLVPVVLGLDGSPAKHAFRDFVELASTLSSPPPSLEVRTLALCCTPDGILLWTNLLRFTDPVEFHLWASDESCSIPPSVRFVPSDFVDEPFAEYWKRLKSFISTGPESVLLVVEGTRSTSAFEACLRRCSPDLPFLHADLWTKTLEGVETLGPMDAEDISKALEEVEVPVAGLSVVSLEFRLSKIRR